jgi:hypothetical protein
MIPVDSEAARDAENLERSVRHESIHGLIHSLTNGRAPGWIDEGLAQWGEGPIHPALRRILQEWLRDRPLIPFKELQTGFTHLSQEKVPAAYAGSLFATQEIVALYGFHTLKLYFDKLKNNEERRKAFRESFGTEEESFQQVAEARLRASFFPDPPNRRLSHLHKKGKVTKTRTRHS